VSAITNTCLTGETALAGVVAVAVLVPEVSLPDASLPDVSLPGVALPEVAVSVGALAARLPSNAVALDAAWSGATLAVPPPFAGVAAGTAGAGVVRATVRTATRSRSAANIDGDRCWLRELTSMITAVANADAAAITAICVHVKRIERSRAIMRR
jgi:hypothetical protein